VALSYAYNFIKIHSTLRATPAMAAGVTNKLWKVSDLAALWEQYKSGGRKSGMTETNHPVP
jgi:hypothetical protein